MVAVRFVESAYKSQVLPCPDGEDTHTHTHTHIFIYIYIYEGI